MKTSKLGFRVEVGSKAEECPQNYSPVISEVEGRPENFW